jgi:sulfate permease, SulP family
VGADDGTTGRGKRNVPILQGVLPLERARVPADVLAGVTLAALGIPEVMGYAKIAGMPVVTGLYTILIPIAVFAIFGSSRHLVVGADSATAAIMAAGLTPLAATGSPEYVALAGMLALMTAVILLAARLIRLGFLANFLSRTVLVGFLTGVGIQVALGQVPAMLGVSVPKGGTLRVAWAALTDIGNAQGATFVVSISVIVVIVGLKRFTKRVPGALVAVIGAIAAGYFLDLGSKGVALLGAVPSGLPSFGLSHAGLSHLHQLIPTAASIFLVILAQSAATSRAYAARYDEAFDENVDLVGLGLANAAAGLSGTFVVNGSPTKTEIVDDAGGRSQVSQVTTSVITLMVILFLTGPLAYLPDAALAAVVFLIGLQLIDVKGMTTIYRMRRDEFVVAALTAAVVVAVGVEQGIILAIVLSLLAHVRYSYHPYDTVLVRHGLRLRWVPVAAHPETENGLAVYRFASSLFYANANLFSSEVMSLVRDGTPPVRWLCVESAAMADVDWSGGLVLRQLHASLADRGVRLVFSGAADNVRVELERYGIVALVGDDAFFDSVLEVVEAFGRRR